MMKRQEGISIIIRSWDQADFIETFLTSFTQNNTYKPVEVLLPVNNTQDTLSLIKPFITKVFIRLIPFKNISSQTSIDTLYQKNTRYNRILLIDELMTLTTSFFSELTTQLNNRIEGVSNYSTQTASGCYLFCRWNAFSGMEHIAADTAINELLENFTQTLYLEPTQKTITKKPLDILAIKAPSITKQGSSNITPEELDQLFINHNIESAVQTIFETTSLTPEIEGKIVDILLEKATHAPSLSMHNIATSKTKLPESNLKYYKLLCEYFPRKIAGYMKYGNELITIGFFDDAEDVFSAAIEQFPKSPSPYIKHALTAEKKAHYDDAIKRYQIAAELFPNNNAAVQGLERILKNDDNSASTSSTNSWTIQSLSTSFLPHNVLPRSIASLSNGTIFLYAKNNTIYTSKNCGDNFELLTRIAPDIEEPSNEIGRLHSDGEAIYYSSRSTGKLYRYTEATDKFEVVINDLGSVTRGFTQTQNGYRFMGRYSQQGPAILLGSRDGIHWETVYQWDARHIHDVRVNPKNNWLYVIVGEGDTGKPSKDRCTIFRSKDNGQSFVKVFATTTNRPLFTSVNFYGSKVLLGTDHPEAINKILSFNDDGEDKIYALEEIFEFPQLSPAIKQFPFVHYMEWLSDSLFVGFRGKKFCALVESSNLVDWKLIYCTTTEKSNFFIEACVTNGYLFTAGDLMRISSRKAIKDENDLQPGMLLSNKSTDAVNMEYGWSFGIEAQIKQALIDVDPLYEKEICQGFFYRANPLSFEKIHLREGLMFLLQNAVKKDAAILDVGTGTAQFLLYLAKFGFHNLYGWDHNQRWLTAAKALFSKIDSLDHVTLERKEKDTIYDIKATSGKTFDVITMFGLIYGHGVDIEKTLTSVYKALNPGGFFIANNSKHTKDEMKDWIANSGLAVVSVLLRLDAADKETSKIYFCRKPI